MPTLLDYTIPTMYPGGRARLTLNSENEVHVTLPGKEEFSYDAEDFTSMVNLEGEGASINLYGQECDAGFIREFRKRMDEVRGRTPGRALCTFNMSRYTSNSPPFALTLIYQHPRNTFTVLVGIEKNIHRTQREVKALKERVCKNKSKLIKIEGFPLPIEKARQFLDMISP